MLAPLEPRDDLLSGRPADFDDRSTDACQGGCLGSAKVGVVDAGDRNIFRYPNAGFAAREWIRSACKGARGAFNPALNSPSSMRETGATYEPHRPHLTPLDLAPASADGGTGRLDRAYVSVTGRAFVTLDTAKTKEIWRKTDDIWLPGGPGNPNVRLLRVEPVTTELWDGPSSAAVAAFEFARKR